METRHVVFIGCSNKNRFPEEFGQEPETRSNPCQPTCSFKEQFHEIFYCLNPHTHGSLSSSLSQGLWAGGRICPRPWELEPVKRPNVEEGWENHIRPWERRSMSSPTCLTPPPPHPVLWTQKKAKISRILATLWHFGHEDLVETKLIIIICNKSIGKAFFIVWKF